MSRFMLTLFAVCLPTVAAAAPPPVAALAYHPNGKLLAAGLHGEIALIDPRTGAVTDRLTGQTGRVTALAFSPDGNRLAAASGEPGQAGIVRTYTVNEQGRPSPMLAIAGHKDILYALAFHPDGKRLATAGYDRVIRLWDLSTATAPTLTKPVHELKDHSDTIYSLSFHPDGKLLASAAADRAVKVWDVDAGTRLYTLGDATDWLYAVAWSPNRTHLAAAGVDRSVRVWTANRDSGTLVRSAFAHVHPVWRLAYSADGRTLYTIGEGRTIKAWDAAKLVETRHYPAQPDAILSFALRPDGKQFALGRFDGVALLVDPATGTPTAQPLPAKPVPPRPEKATPAAAPRGKTTTVTVTGTNLDRVTKVSANLPGVGVKWQPGTPVKLDVALTVPAGSPIGALQLTLEGDAGKAAPLVLAIDRHPAIVEAGVTDSARAAQRVTLPTTIAGTVDRAGDADFFRFEAAAGQQVGVQVIAAELGSKLEPALVLTDAGGQVLAEGDTRLGFTLPRAGTYAIGVRDRDYRGGPDMTYRLHIGDVPVVAGVFPLALQRGKTAAVHVHGVNLGPPTGVLASVTVPADAAPGSKVPVTVPPTPTGEKPLGTAEVMVSEFPAVVVDPVAGADLRVPGSADGILANPGGAPDIRFAAKKGGRLVIEVLARRVGSPVDPVIEILDATGKPVPRTLLRCTAKTSTTLRDHDSAVPGLRLETWNDLAINDHLFADGELMRIFALPKNMDDDCQFYQIDGQRLGFLDTTPRQHGLGTTLYKVEPHPPGSTFPPNGHPVFTLFYRNDDGGPGYGKDARLFFDPPADGTYQVRLTDARGSAGPDHTFRVTVRPPRPDFAVSINPTAPAVRKGGAIPIGVTVARLDGFDGPVRVHLEGLPAGLYAPPTFVEAGQSITSFALGAAADATVPPGTRIRLVGRATIGGQDVTHDLAGGLPTLVEPGDVVATTRQAEVVLRPGGEARITVDVARRNGFAGRVPVEVRGLPHGVRVQNIGLNGILITERETSREIVLYAEPWVQPMDHPIVVLARHEKTRTEHAARSVLLTISDASPKHR